MENQQTIAKEVSISGIGLHTGKDINIKFLPAQPNSGIIFVRVDMPDRPKIKVDVRNLVEISKIPRRSCIGDGAAQVHTVEHLMSSLSGLGIDNITIEIDADEVPGLDGSAIEFVKLLEGAGLVVQDAPKKIFQISQQISVEEDGAIIAILPSQDFRISFTLSFPHPLLKAQYLSTQINSQIFKTQIAPARTFCLESEAETLLSKGFGKGASYENTLVIGNDGPVKTKLRFEDEPIRHKILDLIGDLYLLGNIKGHVIAIKSGHGINIKFLKKIALYFEKLKSSGISSPQPINAKGSLDINDIKKVLPHRYPFLLVDKIIEIEETRRIVGIKNVSINEQYFNGHFPDKPVMPGVLILEAMAQVSGVWMLTRDEYRGKFAYFMGIDNAKFRRVVLPGDQLRIEVEVLRLRSKAGQVKAIAYVEDKVAAEAQLLFSFGG